MSSPAGARLVLSGATRNPGRPTNARTTRRSWRALTCLQGIGGGGAATGQATCDSAQTFLPQMPLRQGSSRVTTRPQALPRKSPPPPSGWVGRSSGPVARCNRQWRNMSVWTIPELDAGSPCRLHLADSTTSMYAAACMAVSPVLLAASMSLLEPTAGIRSLARPPAPCWSQLQTTPDPGTSFGDPLRTRSAAQTGRGAACAGTGSRCQPW